MAWAYGQQIWNYLVGKIGNEYGVAGLMGNLDAESGLLPYRKEGDIGDPTYTESWAYTTDVNVGTISEDSFVHDAIGYGLAQWTYYTRKQGLYNYTLGSGYNIENLNQQLEFLWYELQTGYTEVLTTLQTASSIKEASDKVFYDFEKGTGSAETRELLSEAIYLEYHKAKPTTKHKMPLYMMCRRRF